MKRFTEYHNGVAVIKGKRFSEAAKKLAAYEDAEETGGWTPVEDGPPKDDGYILLSFENFTLPCVGRCEQDDEGYAFYIGDDDAPCVKYGLFVNAWMKLPERYRGE